MLYISNFHIHSASLGDPKIVLTSSRPLPRPSKQPKSLPGPFPLPPTLYPVQLTVDQHIANVQEVPRFLDHDAVRQFTDSFGTEIGPYRLFVPGKRGPALKAARTLGDFGLEDYGVSHEPIIQDMDLRPDSDLYVMMGTDGLWEVMDNSEVAGYVHKFAPCCRLLQDNEYEIDQEDRVSTKTATIARLLCEESRKRWFDIIRLCDVESDDVACVVVEIMRKRKECGKTDAEQPLLKRSEMKPRKVVVSKVATKVPHGRGVQCPRHFDARRRSMVGWQACGESGRREGSTWSSLSQSLSEQTELTRSQTFRRRSNQPSLVVRSRSILGEKSRGQRSTLSVSSHRHQVSILPNGLGS